MKKVNPVRLRHLGVAIIAVSFLFIVAETAYFGSNFYPESMAELVCDYVGSTMMGAGSALIVLSIFLNIKKS